MSEQVQTVKFWLAPRLKLLADHLGVIHYDRVYGKHRHPKLARIRVTLYRLLHNAGYSFHDIGEVFQRDHSTVSGAVVRAGVDEELDKILKELP